jgi:hypothetical protein
VASKPAATSPQAGPDDATLLQVTMKTLQNELRSIGTVKFIAFYHKADGSTSQSTHVYQISNVVADPGSCYISYHAMVRLPGIPDMDADLLYHLQDARTVGVAPWGQSISASTDPQVTELAMTGPSWIGAISFTDVTLANRTANNLKKAIKLCGGHLAN